MTDERESFRRILASTSIIGGATAITILVGLVRTKLLALIVGPAGIGLMGVYISVMGFATMAGGMGLGTAGVAEIAASGANRSLARRALWLATLPLSLATALIIWAFRAEIAVLATGNADSALSIGLTGAGAALAIMSASQLAVIQGYQRISGLARARIFGSLLSIAIGVPAVWYTGVKGIVLAVIAVPLASVIAAIPFVPSRKPIRKRLGLPDLTPHWRHMLRLGAALTVSASLGALSLILIRAIVIRNDGIEAAGYYQAAYAASAMNVSLILAAMGSYYLPQLSRIQDDMAAVTDLIDHQIRVGILLAAPLLMLLVALAPVAIHILYSGSFGPAGSVLRWQAGGELMKVTAWALSFFLVARRDSGWFLALETTFVVVQVSAVAILVPLIGLDGTAISYFLAYTLQVVLLLGLCRQRHRIMISAGNLAYLAGAATLLVLVIAVAQVSPLTAGIVGSALAATMALYSAKELELTHHARAWLQNRRQRRSSFPT